jgi:AcrR family transcriptional regulator
MAMANGASAISTKVLERDEAPAARGKSAACITSEHADPRVRRTRKLLQDAFRELIHEKAFSEISIQHITDRATVNRATFYAHYNDKQDLAISVVKTDLQTSVVASFAQRPPFTRQSLIVFSTTVFEFLTQLYGSCPKANDDLEGSLFMAIQDELHSLVYRWIGHERAYLNLFPGSSREAVATVISSSIYGAANRWLRSGRLQKAEEVSSETVAVLIPK